MLTVKNITKSYGKHNILKNISFDAKKGECIGILGANGCGKSTLLSILAGTLSIDDGSIAFSDGTPYSAKTIPHMIGYVPQENPLFNKLTALDNLRFWYGNDKKQLTEDLKSGLPALFSITDYLNKRVENMSGGMKKRLSIACSLSKHQPILILDEPCAALDLPCKQDIHNYIKSYLKAGNTVIITSHEEADIALCDTLYMIKDGCLISQDKTDINKLIQNMR